MKLGVVVTTYNSPLWLEKALWGYENQQDPEFTLIIADDGSGPETKAVIDRFRSRGNVSIVHEWQVDDGFQKTRILNQCVANTDCDYLVFTDGDCIPRWDYVSNHKKLARQGCFVSGGLYRLNMSASEAVTEAAVADRRAFRFSYLAGLGQPDNFKRTKLSNSRLFTGIMNRITPTRATWNGGNTGCWTKDVVAVNGFDERMQYGGLDREMGERMMNNGVQGRQARYSVITLHLDHSRGYENEETWRRNRSIRATVKAENRVWTDFGIEKTDKFSDTE